MAVSIVRPENLIRALKRLESGSLSIKSRDTDIVKVSTTANEILVDLQNLEVVKELLEPFRKLGVLSGDGKEEEKSVVEKLKMMKEFAEKLREEKTTITIRRAGESVLMVGERAKPRLSRLVLGNSIQANIIKILSLMRALR